jgi:tRNA(fMet)-specific endonuclease VapC
LAETLMLYLLDTNALTRLARGADAAIAQKVEENIPDCRLSAIAWFELQYGAARSPNRDRAIPRLKLLRGLIPAIEDFDEHAAQKAAEIRTILETMRPNAQPIGPYDVLLAGHALSVGAIFVTHNTREFVRVPGLRVEDWQST